MTISALSPRCRVAGDRRLHGGASLQFFHGPMADLVDVHDVDVFAFGLATDFRAEPARANRW